MMEKKDKIGTKEYIIIVGLIVWIILGVLNVILGLILA